MFKFVSSDLLTLIIRRSDMVAKIYLILKKIESRNNSIIKENRKSFSFSSYVKQAPAIISFQNVRMEKTVTEMATGCL